MFDYFTLLRNSLLPSCILLLVSFTSQNLPAMIALYFPESGGACDMMRTDLVFENDGGFPIAQAEINYNELREFIFAIYVHAGIQTPEQIAALRKADDNLHDRVAYITNTDASGDVKGVMRLVSRRRATAFEGRSKQEKVAHDQFPLLPLDHKYPEAMRKLMKDNILIEIGRFAPCPNCNKMEVMVNMLRFVPYLLRPKTIESTITIRSPEGIPRSHPENNSWSSSPDRAEDMLLVVESPNDTNTKLYSHLGFIDTGMGPKDSETKILTLALTDLDYFLARSTIDYDNFSSMNQRLKAIDNLLKEYQPKVLGKIDTFPNVLRAQAYLKHAEFDQALKQLAKIKSPTWGNVTDQIKSVAIVGKLYDFMSGRGGNLAKALVELQTLREETNERPQIRQTIDSLEAIIKLDTGENEQVQTVSSRYQKASRSLSMPSFWESSLPMEKIAQDPQGLLVAINIELQLGENFMVPHLWRLKGEVMTQLGNTAASQRYQKVATMLENQ